MSPEIIIDVNVSIKINQTIFWK